MKISVRTKYLALIVLMLISVVLSVAAEIVAHNRMSDSLRECQERSE